MVRFSLCIVAAALSIAATAASATPFHGIPRPVSGPDAPPAPRMAQYEPRAAVAPPARKQPQTANQFPARVYLLRGFMNVFSLGMDDLAAKLEANGIAATVANHADAGTVINQIVARYAAGDRGPIILIGHSFGADAVVAVAQALDRSNIPVALLILFDGTAPHEAPGNVATAVNFTLRFDLVPAAGFHGTISNVDLRGAQGIDHLTIDKSPSLQAETLDYVLQAASARQNPPARQP
jgi:Thioesterase domain